LSECENGPTATNTNGTALASTDTTSPAPPAPTTSSETSGVVQPSSPVRQPLSPIIEHRGSTKSRTGSTQYGSRFFAPPRSRKLTLTSQVSGKYTVIFATIMLLSGMTSTNDMMSNYDLKYSRRDLNSQMSRMSARSFAQSLSRISATNQPIAAACSLLDVQVYLYIFN
jgi:hypothetical protein